MTNQNLFLCLAEDSPLGHLCDSVEDDYTLCGQKKGFMAFGHSLGDCNTCLQLARHRQALKAVEAAPDEKAQTPTPIPIQLICPKCYEAHIDEGEWATRPHHTHACQQCGLVWRPALVNTVGVKFLPGCKDAE